MSTTGLHRALKRALPWTAALVHRVRTTYVWVSVRYGGLVVLHKIRKPRSSVFRSIYLRQMWGEGSGSGSSLEHTQAVREQLPKLAKELRVRSVLDAPCGDYGWMSQVDWELDSYVGVDIVPELIERNRAVYENAEVRFLVADITRDQLPRADLVFVRDCFVHMSLRDITQALRTLRASGSRYLLTTTYPGSVNRNWNIMTGWWRALDFQRPPFNFPTPERLIDDESTVQYDKQGKSLGLWRFEDLPLGSRASSITSTRSKSRELLQEVHRRRRHA